MLTICMETIVATLLAKVRVWVDVSLFRDAVVLRRTTRINYQADRQIPSSILSVSVLCALIARFQVRQDTANIRRCDAAYPRSKRTKARNSESIDG